MAQLSIEKLVKNHEEDTRELGRMARRIADLEHVLRLVKETYDNITTEQFRNGKDKPARDAVDKALNKPKEVIGYD